MKYYTILVCAILAGSLCFSCNSKTETETATTKTDSVAVKTSTKSDRQLALETFTDFPPEIDGCSCYYSFTADDFKVGKYIVAANLGKDCFIKIGGEMQKLKLVQERDMSQTHTQKVYSGGGSLLTIDVDKTGSVDETWQQKGIIKLEQKNKEVLEDSIIGECGC